MSERDQWAADIRRHEGFRATAYRDSLGHLTIGYGFLIDAGGIPREVAEYWLAYNIDQLAQELDRRIPWWRDQPENVRRAIINMAYNLGVPKLLRFRRMLAAMQEGDYERAADEALDSNWAEQVGRRAKEIAGWIRYNS